MVIRVGPHDVKVAAVDHGVGSVKHLIVDPGAVEVAAVAIALDAEDHGLVDAGDQALGANPGDIRLVRMNDDILEGWRIGINVAEGRDLEAVRDPADSQGGRLAGAACSRRLDLNLDRLPCRNRPARCRLGPAVNAILPPGYGDRHRGGDSCDHRCGGNGPGA